MDRKRFAGPEGSIPYQYFMTKRQPSTQAVGIADDVKRPDGRSTTQSRPIYIRTGLITQANGSAYLELPSSGLKIAAAVHGPRQAQRRETFKTESTVYCTVDFLPFASTIRTPFGVSTSAGTASPFGGSDLQSKRKTTKIAALMESWIMSALLPAIQVEKYPKSNIDIFVTIIQMETVAGGYITAENDVRELHGGLCAAALTCASMALTDAGIELYDLVSASYAAFIDGQWRLDPTPEEEEEASAGLALALMPSLNEVTSISQRGAVDGSKLMDGIEICSDGCSQVYAAMSQSLLESLKPPKK